MALRPAHLLPPKRLLTPRSARRLSATDRGLLPGSPAFTRVGLAPTGLVQLSGHTTASSLEDQRNGAPVDCRSWSTRQPGAPLSSKTEPGETLSSAPRRSRHLFDEVLLGPFDTFERNLARSTVWRRLLAVFRSGGMNEKGLRSHLPIQDAPRLSEKLSSYSADSDIDSRHIVWITARQLREEGSQLFGLAFCQYGTQLLRADSKAAQNPAVDDRFLVLKAPQIEFNVDGIDPTRIEQRLGKGRPTDQYIDRFTQKVRARPRASARKRPTVRYPGVTLDQIPETSCLDEDLVVIVNYPTTTTYEGCFWMLAQKVHLYRQALGKQQIILTHELDKLSSRGAYPSRPVGMEVQWLGMRWEKSDPCVTKRSDDLDASVRRGLIGNHDLDVLVRLPYDGVQAGFEVSFTVENGNDDRDQGLSAHRNPIGTTTRPTSSREGTNS